MDLRFQVFQLALRRSVLIRARVTAWKAGDGQRQIARLENRRVKISSGFSSLVCAVLPDLPETEAEIERMARPGRQADSEPACQITGYALLTADSVNA